jgi:hypothetical protein
METVMQNIANTRPTGSRIWIAGVLLSLAVVGCDPPAEYKAEPPPAAAEGLTLQVATADEVSGTYVKADVTVRFASVKSGRGVHFTLAAKDRSVLFDLVDDTASKRQTLTFFGGRLRRTFAYSLLQRDRAATTAPDASEFESVGDVRAAADLRRRPEYGLLPELSRELGTRGLDGRSHPVILVLHRIAMQVAAGTPEMAIENAETVLASLAPGSGCYPISCPNGGQVCLGTSCYGAGNNYCPTAFGADLRSDPCHNQCYGMCGPGCTCWEWACGDCSYHSSCAEHDDWCRSCSWGTPWDCALCDSPAAVWATSCNL